MSAFLIYVLVSSLVLGLATALAVIFGRKWIYERDRDRCDHQWEVTDAIYRGPRKGPFTVSGFVSSEFLARMTHGFTTVTQQCTVCHLTCSFNTFGRATIPGRTWTDA